MVFFAVAGTFCAFLAVVAALQADWEEFAIQCFAVALAVFSGGLTYRDWRKARRASNGGD